MGGDGGSLKKGVNYFFWGGRAPKRGGSSKAGNWPVDWGLEKKRGGPGSWGMG